MKLASTLQASRENHRVNLLGESLLRDKRDFFAIALLPPSGLKNIEILLKKPSKNPSKSGPKKSARKTKIFRFPRTPQKQGVWPPILGRSGRAHRVFWGDFSNFSAKIGFYLLLKGFVPKTLKIAKIGQKSASSRFLTDFRDFQRFGYKPL